MNFYWHDWVGMFGVVLILSGFLLLQSHKLSGQGLVYQLLNLVGALGIMVSLAAGNFNLAAFVQELAWFAIAAYGIVRGYRLRRQAPTLH